MSRYTTQFMKAITPGIATAIVSLPLSIGFAIIAGVPPELMIVASIYSAFFNAIFAKSKYGVGGPNTAVALLTGAAIAPFAPAESHLYLGYVFALCVLISIFQLLLALVLRYIDLMDYVSKTVIDGLTVGIGAVFVLSSLTMALGLSPNAGSQWSVFNAFATLIATVTGDANSTAMLIAAVGLITGMACWLFKVTARYAIVIAAAVATVFGAIVEPMTTTPVDHIGWLSLSLLSPSIPDFRTVSWSTLFNLIGPAAAIALIGAIQTLSIAKNIRRLGEPYAPHLEMLSQGLQHLFMGFFSGAPVSNSYNKSMLMYNTHGSKLALVLSAAVTALAVLLGGALLMYIPMPALGACLLLVGMSMLNLRKHKTHLTAGWRRRIIFALSAILTVVLSIQAAILIGTIANIVLHLIEMSQPRFNIRQVKDKIFIKITSPIFFTSGSRLNRYIERMVNFNDNKISYATVDLTDAYLLPTDHIDVDWLHRLNDAHIRIVLLVRWGQRRSVEAMLERGIIPEYCVLRYREEEEDAPPPPAASELLELEPMSNKSVA